MRLVDAGPDHEDERRSQPRDGLLLSRKVGAALLVQTVEPARLVQLLLEEQADLEVLEVLLCLLDLLAAAVVEALAVEEGVPLDEVGRAPLDDGLHDLVRHVLAVGHLAGELIAGAVGKKAEAEERVQDDVLGVALKDKLLPRRALGVAGANDDAGVGVLDWRTVGERRVGDLVGVDAVRKLGASRDDDLRGHGGHDGVLLGHRVCRSVLTVCVVVANRQRSGDRGGVQIMRFASNLICIFNHDYQSRGEAWGLRRVWKVCALRCDPGGLSTDPAGLRRRKMGHLCLCQHSGQWECGSPQTPRWYWSQISRKFPRLHRLPVSLAI